jgi:Na+/H+ antiporter NhaD/arsenite permease-like protein
MEEKDRGWNRHLGILPWTLPPAKYSRNCRPSGITGHSSLRRGFGKRALALLKTKGPDLAVILDHRAGGLSNFLDNASTYLTFATLASGTLGLSGEHLGALAPKAPRLLEAVSSGAVFMIVNFYIDNGPNFMVKAISDHLGVRAPGFFGHMLWAGALLLTIFRLVALLRFRE